MNDNFKDTTVQTNTVRQNIFSKVFRRFRRDDRGVLAVPTVLFMLAMLAMCGIGMDLVRLERDRTNLQYTLDRAVLAAADLDQELEPADVVLDYLTKAGLEEYYNTPETEILPEGALNPTSKKVSVTVDDAFEVYWMRFANYEDNLPLNALSTAEESIDKVEISLVLDVSGSMANNSRLTNLKTAAKEFVTTLDENTEDGNLSFSIIPYSTQVSMPEEFLDNYDVEITNGTSGASFYDTVDQPFLSGSLDDDETEIEETDVVVVSDPYSHCVNFEADDFETTAFPLAGSYQRTMHFSPWYTNDYRDSSSHVAYANCASDDDSPERTALLFEDDEDTLHDYIDAFEAGENTSIDLGMKWGVAMLDPSIQPVIEDLTEGDSPFISDTFSDRPAAYSDSDTLKVIVLMTDGSNTSQYYIEDEYRDGYSGVWYNEDEEVYSTYIYDADNDNYQKYYNHDTGDIMDAPYGNGQTTTEECTEYNRRGTCTEYSETTEDDPGTAIPLTFEALFADTTTNYVAYSIYSDWLGTGTASIDWRTDLRNSYGTTTKNSRTSDVCEAARDAGITVFTIGFEAPSSGETVLKDCASSDSHYYDVDGLEISDAFASIATAIRQLRLTE